MLLVLIDLWGSFWIIHLTQTFDKIKQLRQWEILDTEQTLTLFSDFLFTVLKNGFDFYFFFICIFCFSPPRSHSKQLFRFIGKFSQIKLIYITPCLKITRV
jgi:hypothetical protein